MTCRWVGLLALAASSCGAPTAVDKQHKRALSTETASDPLLLRGTALAELASMPEALERVKQSPFQYFRYLAGEFAEVVCSDETVDAMPTVNLHGDAHIEQYAIADDGFGIVDFDDATLGPPILDWMRFSTSVWLADIANDAGNRAAIARFVQGYELGVRNQEGPQSVEPAVARRVRAGFNTTPLEWLEGVTRLMQPMDGIDQQSMQTVREQYVRVMLDQNPDLTASFFSAKAAGALNMGIGSARESKFLIRVEGPTSRADDDVILEKKEMKASRLGRCTRGRLRDPRRVINAQSRFSRSPQRLLGYLSANGTDFYVHAWRIHYTEVGTSDIRNATELSEIAFDFGLQLGHGHPRSPPDSELGIKERAAILSALHQVEPRLANESKTLADRTRASYARLRGALPVGR